MSNVLSYLLKSSQRKEKRQLFITDTRRKKSQARVVEELLDAFFSDKSENTVLAYNRDFEDLSAHLGTTSIASAVNSIIICKSGEANRVLDTWKTDMVRRCSLTTANRRLAAVQSVLTMARRYGLTDVNPQLKRAKIHRNRLYQAPRFADITAIIKSLEMEQDDISVRDTAIFKVLLFCGLRRSELASVDLCHWSEKTLLVAPKGHGDQRETVYLPDDTHRSIARFVGGVRGIGPGPLFCGLNHGDNRGRLTASGIYKMVGRRGREFGLQIHPHDIRRACITEAFRLCAREGLDITNIVALARHADVRTTLGYKNQMENAQAEISDLLAEESERAAETTLGTERNEKS